MFFCRQNESLSCSLLAICKDGGRSEGNWRSTRVAAALVSHTLINQRVILADLFITSQLSAPTDAGRDVGARRGF